MVGAHFLYSENLICEVRFVKKEQAKSDNTFTLPCQGQNNVEIRLFSLLDLR